MKTAICQLGVSRNAMKSLHSPFFSGFNHDEVPEAVGEYGVAIDAPGGTRHPYPSNHASEEIYRATGQNFETSQNSNASPRYVDMISHKLPAARKPIVQLNTNQTTGNGVPQGSLPKKVKSSNKDTSPKMIPVIACWGGRIAMNGEMANYEGGKRRLIGIERDSTFFELKEKLCRLTKCNSYDHYLRILAKFPLCYSGKQWGSSEIVDDESTSMLIALSDIVTTIQLLVEVPGPHMQKTSNKSKNPCTVPGKCADSSTRPLSSSNVLQNTTLLPQGASNVPHSMIPQPQGTFNVPGSMPPRSQGASGIPLNTMPQSQGTSSTPHNRSLPQGASTPCVRGPFPESAAITGEANYWPMNPQTDSPSITLSNLQYQTLLSSLLAKRQEASSPQRMLKRTRHGSPTFNYREDINFYRGEKIDNCMDSKEDNIVDDTVGDNCYVDPVEDVPYIYETDVTFMDATGKDNCDGSQIYLSQLFDYFGSDVEMWSGREFSSKHELEEEVRKWHEDHHVRYATESKTDTKCAFKCWQRGCRWRLSAIASATQEYKVCEYSGPHTCASKTVLSHSHICQMILPAMRENVILTIAAIQEQVKTELNVDINYGMAWHARTQAMREIYGSEEQSFKDLRRYMKSMVESNPGTVVFFDSDSSSYSERFKRVFWSFAPSIGGFKHCLPVISIGCTQLRGKYLGSVVAAVGYDGDNGLFPLAFAVVEKESQESWQWFLGLLASHVTKRDGLCIISNKTSELKEAVRSAFPPHSGHVHRFCLRQMRADMCKAGFKEKKLLELFYVAGGSIEKGKFEETIKKIFEMDNEAYSWILSQGGFEYWALSHDNGRRFCYMTTNFYETHAFFLKKCLGLPIVALVNTTFLTVQRTFIRRQCVSQEWKQRLTPSIEADISDMEKEATDHKVESKDLHSFLVTDNKGDRHEVVLNDDTSSCSCCYTELALVPCSHLIAVCKHCRKDHRNVASMFYSAKNYRLSYGVLFHPICDKEFWPPHAGPEMIPPIQLNQLKLLRQDPVPKHGSKVSGTQRANNW